MQNICMVGHLYILPGYVNVIAETMHDRTPVNFACCLGRVDSVRELLQHPETDVHAADLSGQTPLQLAHEDGHFECVRVLHQA